MNNLEILAEAERLLEQSKNAYRHDEAIECTSASSALSLLVLARNSEETITKDLPDNLSWHSHPEDNDV